MPTTTTTNLQWWRQSRFGMFIHWGPSTLSGKEISWSRRDTGEAVYDNLYKHFNPTKFDAHRWVELARKTGMKYIVLTAKHHDGFLLWNSKTSDYDIMNTPFGRDVVAELSAASREAGIPFCVYFSPGDWHDPDCRSAMQNDRFVQRMHTQLTELLSNYGPIPLVWFDFDGYPNPSLPSETATLARSLSPGVILTNRLTALHPDESHGRVDRWGDYATPEQFVGGYCDGIPWETCMTIATQWSWKPNDKIKSLQQCLETLASTVGGDGNLLFNVGPMPTGEIEPAQVDRLEQMGGWLAKHGEAIYNTRGGPYIPTALYASTRNTGAVYVHVFRFTNGSITLPPFPGAVREATLLDGTPVKFDQAVTGLTLTPAQPEANITVIKLKIDGNPADIAPIPPASTSGSLAYRAQATVSSSIAPLFMHDAAAALDDNDGTFWSPGRNEAVADLFAGRNFEQVRRKPEHPAWQKSGWLEVKLRSPSSVSRAVIKERVSPDNYSPVSAWKIECETNGTWQLLAGGTNIGKSLEVKLPAGVTSQTFRLSIEASGRPAIAEFQLYP